MSATFSAEVLQVAARAYGVPPAALLAGRRGRRHEGRQVALWLVKTHCDLTHAETARQFGLGSPGTVRWASATLQRRARAERRLRGRLAQLETALAITTSQPAT